jgi:adenylate kinase family enzyme
MRISIIGQPASGKSALATAIGKKFGIPHLHIDRFYFEARALPKDGMRAYIKKKVEEYIQQESWVSDGWYSRVQPIIAVRADKIIYLDIPFFVRLRNHFHRAIFDDRHPELSAWDEVTFVFDMIKRIFTHAPKMEKFTRETLSN